jgi:hypothetical protein
MTPCYGDGESFLCVETPINEIAVAKALGEGL